MGNKRVPEIRFPGFTGDWEQCELGDLSDVTKLAGFEFTNYVNYSDVGSIPAIRGLNVKNGSFIFKDVKYIDNSDFSKLNRSKLLAGDIVFTYVGTVGESAIVPKNVNWYLAPNVSRIRAESIKPEYLIQLFMHPTFRNKEIETWIATSSQPALSMGNIRKFIITFPAMEEQIKIGNFFKQLDDTIALHQQELTTLKQTKQGFLQKMFPKEGETVPEVRFPGFTGEWEHCKARELCTISTGKGNTQDKVEYGKYPFYVRSATIERSNDFLYDQEAVLTVGDGVGTGKVFHYVNGKYNLHQRVYRMYDFNSTVSAKYFYYYFSKNFYRRVMAMTAKTSVDSVRMEMIADMDIIFPNEQEQKKIVDLFDSLENTITLHQRELTVLQETKKAFLQKMFV
ncbi:restriction endonuclease subunit S [Virgibacillus halodenitrificans]|uniref:restriction endonuclease subunit S n=1 Tax=Virgibacillus halodenitrificans TaxID=1482 RepID=UPI0007614653